MFSRRPAHSFGLALLVILALPFTAHAQWYSNYDFTSKGVVAYWPFDDDSSDKSGHANNGTWSGSDTFTTGHFASGHTLSPVTYYSVNSTSLRSLSKITIAAWAKVTAIVTNETLLGTGTDADNRFYLFVLLQASGTTTPGITFSARTTTGDVSTDHYVLASVIGSWHHYAATFDGTTSRLYIDGSLVLSHAGGSGAFSSATPFYINHHDWNGGSSSRLSGVIDDAVVFNRALSASEIALLAHDNNANGIADFWEAGSPTCTLNCTASAPTTGTTTAPVTFTASATTSGSCSTPAYSWDFNDGATSTQQNPSHTYRNPGTYNWKVTITSSNATPCTRPGAITITAVDTCTLSCYASAPSTGTTQAGVNFTAGAYPSSACPPATYVWDFGDGGSSTLRNPSHIYSNVGSYSWSVTISAGSTVCTPTKSGTITIGNDAPPVIFAYGYCGDTTTWNTMVSNLRNINGSRYAGQRVDLYYDGQVRVYGTNSAVIPAATMYGIAYFDRFAPTGTGFDASHVTNLAIESLADQLSHVIAAVRTATHASRVDLVTHSMGGLVGRAYVEGVGGDGMGATTVRTLVTLDTPHRGADSHAWDAISSFLTNRGIQQCVTLYPTTQRDEMSPASGFLASLNSRAIPSSVRVVAVGKSYEVDCFPCSLIGDGVVDYANQDLTCAAATGACNSIYDCQTNVRFIGDPRSPDNHETVHEHFADAQLVNQQLSGTSSTASCTSVTAGGVLAVAAPTTSMTTNVSVLTTFTTGVATAALADCAADVVIVDGDGSTLASATVPASGTQQVSLGIVQPTNWHVEVRPSCSVTVTVDVTAEPVKNPKHRAAGH